MVVLACVVLPEPMLNSLLRRMPALESAEIHQLVNCPESFTPDMRCLMGETPGVSGYYVLAGMNSSGLTFAGGAGKYLAEWMTYGYPTANVWPLDIKRFGNLQSSRTFLRHRVMEVMRKLRATAKAGFNRRLVAEHCFRVPF